MAEPNATVNSQDLVNFVLEQYNRSYNAYNGLFKKFGEWYYRYRGWATGNVESFRNQLQIPVALSLIQADVSRKTALTCGGWPIVQFQGYDPADPGPARKAEVLVSAQMEDLKIVEKLYDHYLTADLMGTGVLRTGWKVDKKMMKYRYIDPITNSEAVDQGLKTLFDGPDVDNIDPRDFFPDPSCKRWRDCTRAVHRYTLSIDQVQRYEKDGIFRKGSTEALKNGKAAPQVDDSFRWRPWSEFSQQGEDKYFPEVEVLEFNGIVPNELAKDGYELRTIAIGNRHQLLSDDPFPFWHGSLQEKFILFSPMPDPFQLWGTGKMEILNKPQAAINKLGSLKLDILEMFASPMFFYDRSSGLDLQNLKVKPGRWFGIDGPVDQTKIQPLIPNMSGLNAIFNEMASLSQYMQQGSGIAEDVVMGFSGSDRATAREVVIRHDEVMKRLGLEAKLAEKVVIEPLGNTMMNLNRQYLTLPKRINILGSRALVNPITGLPYPQEVTDISLTDIHQDYKARAIGASLFINRTQRKADGIALLQAFTANPVAMQVINWSNMIRQMFELTDFGSPDELLVQNVPAINMLASQNGGSIPTDPMAAGQMPPMGMDIPQEMMNESAV